MKVSQHILLNPIVIRAGKLAAFSAGALVAHRLGWVSADAAYGAMWGFFAAFIIL